jgi:hypothetical protein
MRRSVGASLTSNHPLADFPSARPTAKCQQDLEVTENIMKSWAPKIVAAALALGGATLGFAQVGPSDAPRGATHDCAGMTGTALATCLQLNRNVNQAAPSGAGTPNDCSGMTGAPLATCRRLNAAETYAPSTAAGVSDDCSGQIGDALKACRALNGQSTENDTSTAGPATTGPQQ